MNGRKHKACKTFDSNEILLYTMLTILTPHVCEDNLNMTTVEDIQTNIDQLQTTDTTRKQILETFGPRLGHNQNEAMLIWCE